MKTSRHARERCQSRGIPADCREILIRHGVPIPRPGSAEAYYLPNKAKHAAMRECRQLYQALERAANSIIVVSDDGTCITAYKRTKELQKQRGGS